jgi:heme oxygenase
MIEAMAETDPSGARLAERLRTQTTEVHAIAERTGVMRDILGGRFGRPLYCALLRNLYEIYNALEPALTRHAADPCIAPVFFPALFRREALCADLDALAGPRWSAEIDVSPAAGEYRRRIGELAQVRPALLVAHAYARYLGDLHGGRILRRIVADTLALGPGPGLEFYAFGAVGDLDAAVRGYRAGLDALPVDATTAHDIVREAQRAFELHIRLFDELTGASARGARQAARSAGY